MRTRVGYAGGAKKNPSYYSLGDHTEAIQIDYDPDQISYKDLLKIFWSSHNPSMQSRSRQYMNAVFYHDDHQKKIAETSMKDFAEKTGRAVKTAITPVREFYRAEDYHQKYALSHQLQLIKELRAIYPEINDYVDSTAVARINGYVSGRGSLEDLKKELGDLGLSPEAGKTLLDLVKRREQRARMINPFRIR